MSLVATKTSKVILYSVNLLEDYGRVSMLLSLRVTESAPAGSGAAKPSCQVEAATIA